MHLLPRLGLALVIATSVVSAAEPQRDTQPAASAPARADSAARLTGRIVTAADGLALQRALVAITVSGRIHGTVFTDTEGRFDIDAPNAVPYTVTVSKSGYSPATLPRPGRPGRSTLDLSLARAAVITGRVVDPAGNPVVGIPVIIQRMNAGQASFDTSVMTDDLGSYRVAGLSAGRCTITTRGSPEYAASFFGQTRTIDANYRPGSVRSTAPPATTAGPVDVDVETGTRHDLTLSYRDPAVVLPYAKVGSVVSGQITDDAGEPAVGLTVQLWRLEFTDGAAVASREVAPRTTDDRGQYRMFHVKAGRYVLVVIDESSQTSNRESVWLPVYYPGTVSSTAATILTVGRSQELGGNDMVFTHTAGARVFGRALNAAGQPLHDVLSLLSASRDLPVVPQTILADSDGGFAFDRVPPGEYVIRASAFSSGSGAPDRVNPELGLQRVQVGDADVGPLAFRTAESATLRGRIVFEGMPPLSENFEVIGTTTDPAYTPGILAGETTMSIGTIDHQTWTFELPRLAGPIRVALSAVPPDVWLKSAYVGSVNAVETPVLLLSAKDSRDDVTLVVAGTAAAIEGRTVTSAATPALGAQVLAFSTSRPRWFSGSPFVKSIYSDEKGAFSLDGLPPGEYWIVAIDSPENELDRSDGDRIELLESLSASAPRVTLGDGQVLSFNPRTIEIRH